MTWEPGRPLAGTEYSGVLKVAQEALPRMARRQSPVAFLISHRSSFHVAPDWKSDLWPAYASFMRYIQESVKSPVLTLYADAAQRQLADNPQLQLLILEESFPLTEDQMQVVIKWWTAEPRRNLIIVGSGLGVSADPCVAGPRPMTEAFPTLLEAIGLRQCDPPSIHSAPSGKVRLMLRGPRKPRLPENGTEVEVRSVANVQRIFGSGSQVLYSDDEGRPVIAAYHSGTSSAYFCGLGSTPQTAPIIAKLTRHASLSFGAGPPPVTVVEGDALWNATQDGYAVVANHTDEPSRVGVVHKPNAYWDIFDQTMVKDDSVSYDLQPNELRVIRWVGKTAKLVDVANTVYVHSITGGAGKAEVHMEAAGDTEFVVRTAPRKIMLDEKPHRAFSSARCGDFWKITIHALLPGRHVVTMLW